MAVHRAARRPKGCPCLTLGPADPHSAGRERTASEMADLLYHAMVLLNVQGVALEEVLAVLRGRFGTSGIDEKAARPPKPQ